MAANVAFDLDGKTYMLTAVQSKPIQILLDSESEGDRARAEKMIRQYAVRVIKGGEVVSEIEEPPASGGASQGQTSTLDF